MIRLTVPFLLEDAGNGGHELLQRDVLRRSVALHGGHQVMELRFRGAASWKVIFMRTDSAPRETCSLT